MNDNKDSKKRIKTNSQKDTKKSRAKSSPKNKDSNNKVPKKRNDKSSNVKTRKSSSIDSKKNETTKSSKNILSKTMSIPLSAIKSRLKDNSYGKKESPAVKEYKKNKEKKLRQKRQLKYCFNLDLLDILIIIVITAIVSCILTGFIINYEFKKSTNLVNREVVADKNIQEFLNTYSEILENYYEEIDKEAMMGAAMAGMLSYLKDNYSIYLNENDSGNLSESLDGSYNGLGIVVKGNIIESVYKNSPAEKVGLKAGDEIIEINGEKISLDNYEDIGKFLKKDKENDILVLRKKEKIPFKVSTNDVYIPATTSDIIKSPDKKKNLGYISLTTFSLMAYEDFKESLKTIEEEQIDSLIIDLRNNTGGYLNVASNIASLFLEKDKVIYSLENKNKITTYKDETDEKRDYEIVVLVNGNTASASEILASALHDSYGATIVGKKTYGKGKVQTMKYYEGSIVKYTSAKWLRPNGDCIDEEGIIPDYEIGLTIEDKTIYDKQLDKAIELLSK